MSPGRTEGDSPDCDVVAASRAKGEAAICDMSLVEPAIARIANELDSRREKARLDMPLVSPNQPDMRMSLFTY